MKQYNHEPYIVSFTSFGTRFKTVGLMILSLLKQTYKRFHICMTVYKDDIPNLTEDIKSLIRHNIIEIIIADKNLCPHLKYFYAMNKYHNTPIITVDDDRVYSNNVIQNLVDKYEHIQYKSVVCTCAPKMIKQNNYVMPDSVWCTRDQRLSPNESSYIAMAEGFGGILYPANCFTNLDHKLDDIYSCLYHDDLLLKVFELDECIPVTQINGIYGKDVIANDMELRQTRILNHHNTGNSYRNNMVELFNSRLMKAWLLP